MNNWRTRIMALNPCPPAGVWLDGLPAETTAEQALATCERGDWLVWLATSLGLDVAPVLRVIVLRAVRVHAAGALRRAGLADAAATLEALPDDVSLEVAAAADAAATERRQQADEVRTALGPQMLAVVAR